MSASRSTAGRVTGSKLGTGSRWLLRRQELCKRPRHVFTAVRFPRQKKVQRNQSTRNDCQQLEMERLATLKSGKLCTVAMHQCKVCKKNNAPGHHIRKMTCIDLSPKGNHVYACINCIVIIMFCSQCGPLRVNTPQLLPLSP